MALEYPESSEEGLRAREDEMARKGDYLTPDKLKKAINTCLDNYAKYRAKLFTGELE